MNAAQPRPARESSRSSRSRARSAIPSSSSTTCSAAACCSPRSSARSTASSTSSSSTRRAARSSSRATTASTWCSPITSCPSSTASSSSSRFARSPHCVDVPIVVITVVDDRRIRYDALEAGATDFLIKPLDEHETRARCANLLELRRHKIVLSDQARVLQYQVDKSVAEIHERELETLAKLAKAGEFRDKTTGNHLMRMAKYSALIGAASRPRRRDGATCSRSRRRCTTSARSAFPTRCCSRRAR